MTRDEALRILIDVVEDCKENSGPYLEDDVQMALIIMKQEL